MSTDTKVVALATGATESTHSTYVVEVVERRTVGEGTVSLTFARTDGEEFPQWTPGAHIDVHLGLDAEGEPLIRQYSVWSSASDRTRMSIGVLRDPDSRGGSARVHDELHPGRLLTISAPRNHFELGDGEQYALVAGGIGITPILAMAHQLEAEGKQWRLHYLVRSRARLAFLEAVQSLPTNKVVVHIDDENGPFDLPGFATDLEAGSAVYACGPARMLEALESLSAESQCPWTFRCERFGAVPVSTSADRAFTVELSRSDRTLEVPAGTSCLQVLRDAGVDVDWSCREGTCGTCEVGVLSGQPDHRDAVLTPEERAANETMMVCVSRARGDGLVLDL
jgi:ferredoxin-NADP reductase